MMRRKTWYLLHRWIGLVVSVQLLAWSVGGFVFSVLDIHDVRGESDRTDRQATALDLQRVNISPAGAIAAAKQGGCNGAFTEIRLRERLGVTVYEILDAEAIPVCAVDATSGSFIPTVSAAEAERVALGDFAPAAVVASVRLIENDAPSEYRGGPLPAYQVILDHPSEPHLYVRAVTGQVTARRNNLWRTFDFFWMLHIMDYGERENFNHWLLTFMSALAILTSASGLALWWWRIPRLSHLMRRRNE